MGVTASTHGTTDASRTGDGERARSILLPGSMLSRAAQLAVLVAAVLGLALAQASGLLMSHGATDVSEVLSVHHYIGRVASIVACFVVALLFRKRAPHPAVLLGVVLVCELASVLLGVFAAPLSAGSTLAQEVMTEASRALDDGAVTLLTLLLLVFLSSFVPRASATGIALAMVGAHVVFLVSAQVPPDAVLAMKSWLPGVALILAAACYVVSGMARKGGGFSRTEREGTASKPFTFFGATKDLALVLAGVVVFPFLFVLIAEISDSAGVNPGMFSLPVEVAGIAVLLVLAAAFFFWRGTITIEATFVIVMPFFATAMVLIPLFWGNETFAFGILIKCGFLLYNVLFWSFLARQVHGDGHKGLLYFAVATGTLELFALLGRTVGSFMFSFGTVTAETIANVSLAAIWILAMGLLVFFLLFRRRERALFQQVREESERAQAEAQACDRFMEKCELYAQQTGLSERELEVLAEFARGRSADYIAKTFYISRETVKTHLKRIYAKGDVHNRQELLDAVERCDLLDEPRP